MDISDNSIMNIPGFVDLQVNGFGGVDFSSPELTEEDFVDACKALIRQGTVAFLPTLITSSPKTYEKNLGLIARAMDREDLRGHLLGIHLEGPFISPIDGARGAHDLNWVHQPDIPLLDKLHDWAHHKIRLLTIAAEPVGADEVCRHASNLGITVSLGHQMALEADLNKLAASGARALTHLGNALPAQLPRHENPLWAGLANDELQAMIIADGHHLPPSILKVILRTKGFSNTIVVSDASPIAGLPPGRYRTLGNEVVLDSSGLVYNPQTGYMVGSSATMLDCMNHLSSLQLMSTEELITTGFHNPLRLIHVDPQWIMDNTPACVEIKTDERFGLIDFEK